MKHLTLFLLTTLSLLLTTSVVTAQDTETRSLSSFNGVATTSSIDAEVVKGSKNQVIITAKGVDLDKITTEIEDGVLKLGFKRKSGWNWPRKSKVSAKVTYTDNLNYLSASSSGDMIVKDVIRGGDLKINVSSSGDMIVEVDVDELNVSASSSGDVEISGSAGRAKLSASSSGDILGRKLSVDHVTASASSSGDVEITANQSIKASASSGGDIDYWGNPGKKDINKSSGGDVNHN